MVRTAVFVLAIGSSLLLRAAEIPWANPVGGSVSVGANWTGGKVPGAADTGILGLSSTYTIQAPEALTTTGLKVTAGDATLDLSGKQWTLSQPMVSGPGLLVGGAAPSGGKLRVSGGTLQANSGAIGVDAGSMGLVEVKNAGKLNSLGLLTVGGAGEGDVELSGGSAMVTLGSLLAQSAGGSGSVTLSGANTAWTNSNFRVDIGSWGTGEVRLSQGARFFNSAETVLGYVVGSQGNVFVQDAASSFQNVGRLTVGRLGVGSLNFSGGAAGGAFDGLVVGAATSGKVVLDGGRFDAAGSAIPAANVATVLGEVQGGIGTLELLNGASFKSATQAQIGREGNGFLTISGGAQFTSSKTGSTSGSSGIVGRGRDNASATGEVSITGLGSAWQQDGDLTLGLAGHGTFSLADGATATGQNAFLGREATGVGVAALTGQGTQWNLTGGLYLGGDVGLAGGSGQLSVADGAKLLIGGALTIWGNGAVDLDGGAIEAKGGLQLAPGAELQGIGNFNGPIVNLGLISPGHSPGTLNLSGSFEQRDSGALRIQLGADGNYDRLVLDAAAALGGTLQVELLSGFTPKAGDEFTILSAGKVSGRFDNALDKVTFGGGTFDVLYSATGVTLKNFALNSLPGDANSDGRVDLTDFGLLKSNFGKEGGLAQGDFDGSGKIDLTDFGILKSHFGQTQPTAGVPEPSTLALALLGVVALGLARRRRSN
jgi:T5SS/PEP-CTERM-associated repeat protein